jgi:transcriptional regulator with XRE-family HTH domain
MEQHEHITDNAALSILGQSIAQHRLEQNRTQAELAREAGVSKRTIERLEGGESIHTINLVRVLRVLGLLANLNELVPTPVPSPLEALRTKEKRRKRASGRSQQATDTEPGSWTWGDNPKPEG